MPSARDPRLHDIERLAALRRAVDDITRAEVPAGLATHGEPPAGTVGVVAGSFNPPTLAHISLARSALDTGRGYFSLSVHTVNKERIEGASMEDRLLLLELVAAELPGVGILLINRGLYVDQAELIRRVWPDVDDVVFVVGFDKLVQLFDPRYYEDRDTALERLFGAARFLVAPRDDKDEQDVLALVERAENRRWADRVAPTPLVESLRRLSSSEVRRNPSGANGLPEVSRRFVEECGAYDADPARYRARLEAVARAAGSPTV